MMNSYDHLLTRVFDNQEKRMIYLGDELVIAGDRFIFLAINNGCIFVEQNKQVTHIKLRDYQDRFIPLLCTAYKDKNEKLIFEHDIIKTSSGNEYVVERYNGMFVANGIKEPIQLHHFMDNLTVEISGNVHEHLNPLKKEAQNEQ